MTNGLKATKSHFFEYAACAVLILTLVGYPLVAPISLFFNLDSLSVSIPYRAFIIILSLTVIIRGFFLRDRFPFNAFWIIWWTFWGIYISRIAIDGLFNPDALRLPLLEYYGYALGFSMLPALAVSIKLDDILLRRVLVWIIIVGVIGAALNLWFITSQQMFVTIMEITAGRQETETFNAISLSHLGVTIFILSAWMLVMDTYGTAKMILLIVCLLAGAGTTLVGASRGPLLVLAITLPIIMYLGIRNLRGRKLFYLFAATGLFILAFVQLVAQGDEIAAIYRMRDTLFSDEARMTLLADGWKLFLSNPLLGAGTEPLGFYPHNVILESFILSGVASGFLFVIILMIAIAAAVRIFFSYPRSSWLSLLCLQYIVAAMFTGALYDNAIMWVIIAAVVSQLNHLRFQKYFHQRQAAVA